MKTTRTFILVALALILGFATARWCAAQTYAPDRKPLTGQSNPALDRLEALVSYLEANKQTNAMELFNQYSSASIAQENSADMGMTLHVLMAVREGRTNDVITLLESKLNGDIVSFAASYKELPKDQQEWLGLNVLSQAHLYRNKFPYQTRSQLEYDSLTRAFQLLDKKDTK